MMVARASLLVLLALSLLLRAFGAEAEIPADANPLTLAATAQQASQAHDYGRAVALMRAAIARKDLPEFRYNLACYLALGGDRDQAFTELAASIDLGFADADHLLVDTDLASLHDDARFQQQVDRARQAAKAEQARQAKLATLPPPKDVFELPAPDAAARPVPLIVALHGVGGNPEQFSAPLREWARQAGFALLAIGGSRALSENGDRFAWTVPRDIDRVHRILADLLAKQPIDPARVYLVGFSQGGVMSYPIAFRDPSRFAGVISMSGSLQPETIDAKLMAAAAPKLPIAIIHGEQDPIMPFALGRTAEERLRAARFDVVLYPFTGGHSFAPDWKQLLPRAIGWIDEHRHASQAGGPGPASSDHP
jgi:predicted esterase